MKKITGIKAISFDMDGTLWDFDTAMRRALGAVLEELRKTHPEEASDLDVEKMIEIRDRVGEDLRGKVLDLGKVRLKSFEETLDYIGKPDDELAVRLNRIFFDERLKDITLYEDVTPTLEALRPGYTLGLISNGNAYPHYFGLKGVFQFSLFSQDCGIEKPDPGIFELAAEKAGCEKQELLHVGDSLEGDVAGALNAGIRCAWLNRSQAKNDLNVQPDCEISSLAELPDIL